MQGTRPQSFLGNLPTFMLYLLGSMVTIASGCFIVIARAARKPDVPIDGWIPGLIAIGILAFGKPILGEIKKREKQNPDQTVRNTIIVAILGLLVVGGVFLFLHSSFQASGL